MLFSFIISIILNYMDEAEKADVKLQYTCFQDSYLRKNKNSKKNINYKRLVFFIFFSQLLLLYSI